jgi:hypothetical protein
LETCSVANLVINKSYGWKQTIWEVTGNGKHLDGGNSRFLGE